MKYIDAGYLEGLAAGLCQSRFDSDMVVQRQELEIIIDGMHRVAAKSTDEARLVHAMAALIAGFLYHQPLRRTDGEPDAQRENAAVGLHSAHLLAQLNGHGCVVRSDDEDYLAWDAQALGGKGFQSFVEWLAGRTLPDPELRPQPEQLPLFIDAPDDFEPDPGDRRLHLLAGVHAYVCTALTIVPTEALLEIEELSDTIAAGLSESGVQVHQPILHTHPSRQADLEPRQIHERDVAEVMNADLVVVLATAGSTGAGKELAYSERYRALQLILVPHERPLSRLVEGTTADVTVVHYRSASEVPGIIAKYLGERADDLRSRRDARLARPLDFEPLQQSLRGRFTDGELEAVARGASMTVDRLREALASAEAAAAMSLDDYVAVLTAINLVEQQRPGWKPRPDVDGSRPTIGERELLALDDAAALEGWSEAEQWALLTAAREALAASGTRRIRFASARDWIDFKGDLGG